MTDALQLRDKAAEFCNTKWAEANSLYGDAWRCYMELGKHLQELKVGELKGRFKEWCETELEFSPQWVRILIRAYNRYELSGFDDEPQGSIETYAKGKSTFPSNSKTKENLEIDNLAESGDLTLAGILTLEKPMTKKEQVIQAWIDKNPGKYDEIDKEILSKVLPMLKAMVKKHGPIVVLHAQEIVSMIKSKDL
jgi:hypothetical protein